ncbi:MAG TPA: hypothetical protein VG733_17700, partial [Chthoniobacteraceae bacterium]|nr:hypothetical protein [Chthoniobacteraceae bacterium]
MNSIPPSKRQQAGDVFHSIQKSRGRQRSESGVALLIVLGMLILLSVVVIAFVVGVTNELESSTAYDKETTTHMLSDSVLSIVETQIREASTSPGQAWISQPGLLRTFDINGNPVAAFKLYSAPQMVVAGAFDPNADADLPPDGSWLNQPNLYTDINAPVASGTTATGSTNYIFPVIDGNGIQKINISGSSQFAFTTDGTIPSIEGFGTDPTKVGVNYDSSTALSATNNPVPMPLHWLYMLKDGSLIPATAVANSRDVVFTGTLVPTETNPVIARVAFWGDDDTCKLNVNTSSEGTFSDDPVGNTQPFYNQKTAAGDPDPQGSSVFDPNQIFEWDLAQRQPDRNEYQRYPGHPAENCLSVVFGDTVWRGLNLGTGTSATGYATNYGYHTLSGSSYARFVEFFNQLAPRISGMDATSTSYAAGTDNSSRAGTTRPGGTSLYSGGISATMGNGAAIVVDQDRLYATVGEYIYSATAPGASTMRLPAGEFLTGSVSTGGTSVPVISAAFAAKTNFFLSANSNAPELNVFNMPRVCIWPITKTAATLDNPDTGNAAVTATMTAFDKVIAFVCTVG